MPALVQAHPGLGTLDCAVKAWDGSRNGLHSPGRGGAPTVLASLLATSGRNRGRAYLPGRRGHAPTEPSHWSGRAVQVLPSVRVPVMRQQLADTVPGVHHVTADVLAGSGPDPGQPPRSLGQPVRS